MVTNNALNLTDTGIAIYDGAGTFTATTTTQYNTLVGDTGNAIANVSPGTTGQVLTSNGASSNPSYQDVPSSFSPNSFATLQDDFIGALGSTIDGWSSTRFSGSTTNLVAGRPGMLSNSTSGSANLRSGNHIVLGGGEIVLNWVFNLSSLSSNNYVLRCGFGDTADADQANGAYVEYSDTINSGNWVYKTASSSTRTTTNTAIAVTQGWHNVQITVNADATSVSFAVDGVSLGAAITTNIPTAAVRLNFDADSIGAGVLSNTLQIDLVYMTQDFTTSR